MTDRIYDPGKSETASATAMKISPVPDGASLVSVLVKSHFSRPKLITIFSGKKSIGYSADNLSYISLKLSKLFSGKLYLFKAASIKAISQLSFCFQALAPSKENMTQLAKRLVPLFTVATITESRKKFPC